MTYFSTKEEAGGGGVSLLSPQLVKIFCNIFPLGEKAAEGETEMQIFLPQHIFAKNMFLSFPRKKLVSADFDFSRKIGKSR